MRRRLAVVLVLAGLAAGCGGGGGGEDRAVAVRLERVMALAAERTVEAGTSKVSFSVSTELGGQKLELGGEGSFDYEGRRGELSLDLSGLFEAFGIGAATFDVLFDGTVVYMGFPAEIAAQLPGAAGRRWVKLDVAQVAGLEGTGLDRLQQLNQDPSQILDYLRATTDEVESLGEQEVRGVDTTRYRAVVDLRRVPDAVPAELRDATRASIDLLIGQLGAGTLPIEVWIDGDGRLRRLKQIISLPAGAGTSTTEVTMELYDFGTKVEIEPPPADEVIDLASIVRQQ